MERSDGDKCIAFAEQLSNPEGTDWAGRPVVLLDWQKKLIKKILDKNNDGHRDIREARLWLGRGNGKTTLIAIIALYLLFTQKQGSLVCVANTKEQASILYQFMASMITQNERLANHCRIYKGNVRKIVCRYSNSELVVYSSEAIGKLGGNVSVFVGDEIGFWKSGTIWGVIKSSMGKRIFTDPLILGISTAGMDMGSCSFGYQLFTETRQRIDDPSIDPHFYGMICQGDPKKWDDPEEWYRSQPSYKELMTREYIETFIAEAKHSATRLNELLRYYMNQWTSEDGSEPWIPLEKWIACDSVINPHQLKGHKAVLGIDLASRNDMSCCGLLIPLNDGRYYYEPHYWTPSATLSSREIKDGAPYQEFVRGGYLSPVEGDYMDSAPMFDFIRTLKTLYDIQAIGIDPAHGAADITSNLQNLFGDGVVKWIGQGWKTVVPATKEIEKLIYNKQLVYNNNPILKWNASNVRCKAVDETNLMPSKVRSGGRIDGIYALIDAIHLILEERRNQVHYERGGISL